MRDLTEAHFLHQKEGLEPVLSSPLEDIAALAWLPGREELALATNDGVLAILDPVMGLRTLTEDLGEVGVIAVSPDRTHLAVVVRGVSLDIWEISSRSRVGSTPMELLADLWVGWWSGGVAASGRGLNGSRVVVVGIDGTLKASGVLPQGHTVGVGRSGKLLVARVTDEGPEVVGLGRKMARRRTTGHRLRLSSCGMIYGVAEGGVTIWPGPKSPPRTIRGYNITSAALSKDGRLAAMGMRDGALILSEVFAHAPARGAPGRSGGHDVSVRALAFSDRGRWLASAADTCWLWTWS